MVMAISSNQKIGELARIAYLALLHAEGELGDETNTFDSDKLAEQLRSIRSAILNMFGDTDNKVSLDKAIYVICNEGSLVAYYHGDDTDDPDERLAKIVRSSSTSSSMDLRPKEK
jgi:predicted phosphodiesterase